MNQPVVHFELVGRNGTSLEGFVSYSEVFGCDLDDGPSALTQLQDALPDDVTFYVSVRPVPKGRDEDGPRPARPVRMVSGL